MYKSVVTVVVISVLAWAGSMILFRALSRKPTTLGVRAGRLASCPSSPNCVCSQESDPGHAVEPLAFSDDPDLAWQRIKDVLAALPRTVIVTEEAGYLHAECTSWLFRFVDDVECFLDREGKVIHIRSASRAGHSDLGVNRARVEAIRQAFASSTK